MSTLKAKRVEKDEIVHESKNVLQVESEDVVDVVTRFFFYENNLCFHVLLKLRSGEMALINEFKDYTEYTNALSDLRTAWSKRAAITIPQKIGNLGCATLKVA